MKTKLENTIQNGIDRIDQIKKEINTPQHPEVCKAEVYEMWDGIFDPEEE